MKLYETFLSIQGEGPLSGLLTFFIRFTGCNLRCSYCDTKYAYDKGNEKDVDSIIEEAKKSGAKIVCITGGEPLLQNELGKLVKKLLAHDFRIDLETNGSLPLPKWTQNTKITVALDVKCPSSKMSDKILFSNFKSLTNKDFVKFVIGSDQDYRFAKDVSSKIKRAKIFFHPVFGKYGIRELAEKIIKEKLVDITLGIQMHKIIWEPNKRGV